MLMRIYLRLNYCLRPFAYVYINQVLKNQNIYLSTPQNQMLGYQSYVASIRSALSAALCLRDFPSTLFEKDNKPYIQLTGYTPKIDCLIMKPIYLARNKKQVFLIEPSINSCRISFTVKKSDEIDRLIAGKFSGMMAARAELFEILRRKPIEGYDVTFLITSDTLQKYNKDMIIEIIIGLITTLEKDLLQIKLNINTQARIASTFFVDQISNPVDDELF